METQRKAPEGLPKGLTTRAAVMFHPSTLREDDRSVEFVLATEAPANVWSWEKWDVIREVLVSDGVELPSNRQVPLQDSHDRSSIKSTLGSVRDIRIEQNKVVGRLYFARSPEAVDAFEKIRDGHIDSGSVGYNASDALWIDAGTRYLHNGVEHEGPLQLTRKWQLKEYSLVAIGADANAKARSETVNDSRSADENIKEIDDMEDKKTVELAAADAERQAKEAEAKTRAADEALKLAERKLADANIHELCARYDCKELAGKLIKDGADLVKAQESVLEAVAARQVAVAEARSPRIELGEESSDKKRAAIVDGLIIRAFPSSHGITAPAAGNEQFRGRTLLQIGEELLNESGINTRSMSKTEIAGVLLGKRLGQRNAVSTDNTTASFANVTENVLNKATVMGFQAQRHVWNQICSIGSTSDFKPVSRVGFSENADLPLKKEGAEYRESKFSDRKESGYVGTYADKTTLTEEALINDDLGVLTTIPFRKGAAAMRVPEALLFAAINTPPTLNATSLAWFHADNGETSKGNKIVQGDGLNATNLSKSIARMQSFKLPMNASEAGTDYAEIMPRVLLVHPDNTFTARILANSSGLPEADMSSGVINPIREENLIVLSSPRITTPTKFYLFGDPNMVPVCEMLFLDGRVAPEVFLDPSTNIDGLTYRIRIRCGIVVLEWRSALEHAVA